jgi:hypothetical protein
MTIYICSLRHCATLLQRPQTVVRSQTHGPNNAAGAPSLTLMTMKLLVDTRAQRVLYAEVRKDVVDFLFSFLALHAGSAVELLGHEAMVGSVYASVEKLDATYVQPGVAKAALLSPTSLSPAAVGTKSSDLFRLPAPTIMTAGATTAPLCPVMM